jgi:N-acylneuraminate cytidylyltransferase
MIDIAIIPARGGSKRIPRKNIKTFHGKPMIAYAIDAAIKSNLFEHVMVSTDDLEIADIAQNLGAKVPFFRPAELADDHAATVPVVSHAIKFAKSLGWNINLACCIYPCAPFIKIEDLVVARRLLLESAALYSFPVTEFPAPIQRGLKLDSEGLVMPFYPEFEKMRSQDLESAYYDAGQFYWGKLAGWESEKALHANGIGYAIPGWRVVDIDTKDDWNRAELIASSILDDGNN